MAGPIRRSEQAIDLGALTRLYPPAPEFFETRWLADPEQLEHLQLQRLKAELQRAAGIGFYRRMWAEAGFEPGRVRTLADLSSVPQYTVDDIRASIERASPWGDYQGVTVDDRGQQEPLRVFFSGGTTGAARPTVYTHWDRQVGALLAARSYYMSGLRPGDVVLNAWAFGTHNGAMNADEALVWWLGAVPIITSTGQVTPTRRQMELAAEYRASSILTIGDYLLHMAEVATSIGLDPKRDFNIRAFPGPSGGVADRVEAAWGAPAFESYGFHEVSYVAAECPAHGGLHIYEDAFLVEIVDVESGEPVPDGVLGNIVVTCLYKTGSAQVRYNVQDLSRLFPRSRCECGSWMRKMDYFSGRSDNMVKLRGTNVWPEAVGVVATDHDGVTSEYFVFVERVGGRDEMTVQVESTLPPASRPPLAEELGDRLRSRLGVRINVALVPPGHLADATGRVTQGKPRRFEDRRPNEGVARR